MTFKIAKYDIKKVKYDIEKTQKFPYKAYEIGFIRLHFEQQSVSIAETGISPIFLCALSIISNVSHKVSPEASIFVKSSQIFCKKKAKKL